MALQGIQAAELSKNQHWRDFWRRSISDFFNSIDPRRHFAIINCRTAKGITRSRRRR